MSNLGDIQINRYIVGCKFVQQAGITSSGNQLIDTQWDVNKGTLEKEAGISTN